MVTIGGQRYLPFEQVFTVGDGDEPYNTEAKIAAIVNAAPAGVRVKIWQRTTLSLIHISEPTRPY